VACALILFRVLEQFNRYRMREGVFGDPQVQEMAKSMSVAWRWWLLDGAFVPELQNVVLRLLAQVASSCSCATLNSEADYLKPLKANRLHYVSYERLVHTHHNLRILDNIKDPGYIEQPIEWVAFFVDDSGEDGGSGGEGGGGGGGEDGDGGD